MTRLQVSHCPTPLVCGTVGQCGNGRFYGFLVSHVPAAVPQPGGARCRPDLKAGVKSPSPTVGTRSITSYRATGAQVIVLTATHATTGRRSGSQLRCLRRPRRGARFKPGGGSRLEKLSILDGRGGKPTAGAGRRRFFSFSRSRKPKALHPGLSR
jgi:hypothetical protein